MLRQRVPKFINEFIKFEESATHACGDEDQMVEL